ncbi:MAG: PF20097 family protein [Eubacteriales bacterium]|nr:PF20097 family protein [Eubacteriales bacterium]
MLCPICGKEMEKGGLVAQGVVLMWHPEAQFAKKGLGRMLYTEGKPIGRSNVLLGQTRVPDAYYCADCNKVTGIFDVTNGN